MLIKLIFYLFNLMVSELEYLIIILFYKLICFPQINFYFAQNYFVFDHVGTRIVIGGIIVVVCGLGGLFYYGKGVIATFVPFVYNVGGGWKNFSFIFM